MRRTRPSGALEYPMMADERGREGDAEPGVFGNLPGTRPGVRSPRRDAGKPAAGEREPTPSRAAGGTDSKPRAKPERRRAPAARPHRPPEAATAAGTGDEAPARGEGVGDEAPARGRGVEELAWAGITVAAEAATLGVRLLGRAVDTVRRPTDRR